MLTEALTALGAAGGTAVVGAMATDAWKATRDGVVRLFSRDGVGRQDVTKTTLDEDADLLADTEQADREQVRQELVAVWRRRMVQLLDRHPDVAIDLQNLIVRVQAALPSGQQAWVQHNSATAGGTVIAHQGTGAQHIHYDRLSGLVTGEQNSSVDRSAHTG
jgi:hypothetical protein